jgi:hypothetical protein
MQITGVAVNEGRRLVPVKGWDSVVNAITLFGNGYTPGSGETQQNLLDSIEKNSGPLAFGVVLLGSIEMGKRSNLVEKLLFEAGQTLEYRSEFHKSYDYDGMGTSFFKTSVDIKKLGDDMYGIGIHAVYVGDKPEQGLADAIGIPRALLSCSVEVETKSAGDNRFAFDFEPVLRKLDSVLDTKKITGKKVVAAMMTKNEDGDRTALILQEKDGLQVRIQLGRVERRMAFDHTTRKERDTWSAKGSVISGELARDYKKDDENAKATPTFLVIVSSAEQLDMGYRKESKPIWQPEKQQEAIDLANKIAAALQ